MQWKDGTNLGELLCEKIFLVINVIWVNYGPLKEFSKEVNHLTCVHWAH